MSAVKVDQRAACSLSFSACAGGSEGSLTAAATNHREGSTRWNTFDTRDGTKFAIWAASVGRQLELKLDLVPRTYQRQRPFVNVLWVADVQLDALEQFRPTPNIITVHPRGADGLWQLSHPLAPAAALDALKRLADGLGGNHAAAVLEHRSRMPCTIDRLDRSPTLVECVRLELDARSSTTILLGLRELEAA